MRHISGERRRKKEERKKERKKERRRRRRRKNAPTETGPFHNRTHRTFLLFACVETPHSHQNPILLVGEAVACRRPGALVNKLESAWLEGTWLGRDEHLIGTPNGMVRSRALKRRVERLRWDPSLLNAMVWDPWHPKPVPRGRPLEVRSDREPILMGPIPRVQFTPPDDPDAVTTVTPAVTHPRHQVKGRQHNLAQKEHV